MSLPKQSADGTLTSVASHPPPVLNGLLITASPGEVSIAFDHETSARQVIAADVEVEALPGSRQNPGRNLPFFAERTRRVHQMSPLFIPAVPLTSSWLACRSWTTLSFLSFPEISGTVDGAEFAEAVKQVQIAVSKMRPAAADRYPREQWRHHDPACH